jgi:hypothetical protein
MEMRPRHYTLWALLHLCDLSNPCPHLDADYVIASQQQTGFKGTSHI